MEARTEKWSNGSFTIRNKKSCRGESRRGGVCPTAVLSEVRTWKETEQGRGDVNPECSVHPSLTVAGLSVWPLSASPLRKQTPGPFGSLSYPQHPGHTPRHSVFLKETMQRGGRGWCCSCSQVAQLHLSAFYTWMPVFPISSRASVFSFALHVEHHLNHYNSKVTLEYFVWGRIWGEILV